jgi:nucleoid DNA-binding protein
MGERMTRGLLANVLREKLDIGTVESARILNAIFEAMGDEIAKRGWMHISKFGRFSVTIIPARTIKMSLTGEIRHLSETRSIRFRRAPALNAKLLARNTQPPLRYMRREQRRKAMQKCEQTE